MQVLSCGIPRSSIAVVLGRFDGQSYLPCLLRRNGWGALMRKCVRHGDGSNRFRKNPSERTHCAPNPILATQIPNRARAAPYVRWTDGPVRDNLTSPVSGGRRGATSLPLQSRPHAGHSSGILPAVRHRRRHQPLTNPDHHQYTDTVRTATIDRRLASGQHRDNTPAAPTACGRSR